MTTTPENTEHETTESTQTNEQAQNGQQPVEPAEPATDDPDTEQDTDETPADAEDTPADTDDADDDDEQPETPQDDPALKKARKDAAKYRERLRETESKLETLEAGLDLARRQVLYDHHQNLLNGYTIGGNKYSIVPSALNDVLGDDVSQFFDPATGGLNENAYRQHLQTMLETKPHLFTTRTELTQMEMDSKVKTMIQSTGRGLDRFQNAVMSKPNY